MNYTLNIVEHVPVLRYLAARARVILELGTETGLGSTKAFEEGFAMNPGGDLWISIDWDASKLTRPGDKRWNLVIGDTTDRATLDLVLWKFEVLFWNIGYPDLIFIDTHHTVEQMTKELDIWQALGVDPTIWVFHDTWMEGRYNLMTDVIKEFASKQGMRYLDYSKSCNGLGMVFK